MPVKTNKISDNLYTIVHRNEVVGRVELKQATSNFHYGHRTQRNVYYGEKYLGIADNLAEAVQWVREEYAKPLTLSIEELRAVYDGLEKVPFINMTSENKKLYQTIIAELIIYRTGLKE